jgi:hypothetical protein
MSACKNCGKPLAFAYTAGGAPLPMHAPPPGRAVGSVYCNEQTARGPKAEVRA